MNHKQSISTSIHPIRPEERIMLLDTIRGFALFGILLVNMAYFSYPIVYLDFLGMNIWTHPVDQAVIWGIDAFATAKFYTMFSFLFGIGFMIFMTKAEQKGIQANALFRRRIFILLLFGLIHGLFIWSGDILFLYALTAFLLIPFFKKPTKRILMWAIGLHVSCFVLFLLLVPGRATADPSLVSFMEDLIESSYAAFGSGTFGEIITQRIIDFTFSAINSLFIIPHILAMFLFGAYTYRKGWLHHPNEHKRTLVQILITSLIIGAPLSILYASMPNEYTELLNNFVAGPALCFFYVSALALIWQSGFLRQVLNIFAFQGRMALTQYLLQSVICTFIFYRFGLGYYGQVSPAYGLVLTVAIYAFQLCLSYLWFHKFDYGPMEVLWRKLTYRHINVQQ